MIAKYVFFALILISVFMFVKDPNVAWILGLISLIFLYMFEFTSPTG